MDSTHLGSDDDDNSHRLFVHAQMHSLADRLSGTSPKMTEFLDCACMRAWSDVSHEDRRVTNQLFDQCAQRCKVIPTPLPEPLPLQGQGHPEKGLPRRTVQSVMAVLRDGLDPMCYAYAQWLGSHVIQREMIQMVPSNQSVYFVTVYAVNGQGGTQYYTSTVISSHLGEIEFNARARSHNGGSTVDTERILNEIQQHTLEVAPLDAAGLPWPRYALADFMLTLLTTRGPLLSYVTGSELYNVGVWIRIWFALGVSPRISMHSQHQPLQCSTYAPIEFSVFRDRIDFYARHASNAAADFRHKTLVQPVPGRGT
jgi:hypothetical protein